ncbi:hypothetical protein Vretifemale_2135 [Volvox reticuliferus]|nr:hypothetical protein Vretifemale_2135 [Volvox reticuliferus]
MAAKSGGPRTLTNTIKLLINAGAAKPAPPEFNAKTASFKEGTLLRVRMRVFSDKTYEWDLKMPPSTWLIKKATGLARASGTPGHEIVGTISLKHLYEIGRVKQRDMPNVPLQSIVTSLLHTCRSMGVRVVARPEDA